MVLGQCLPRKIAPNPKTNVNLNLGQFSSGAIVRIPVNICVDNFMLNL